MSPKLLVRLLCWSAPLLSVFGPMLITVNAEETADRLVLSAMDDPADWDGPLAPERTKRADGSPALVFNFGKGGDGTWRSTTFAERGIDLDHYDLLKFDYRIENAGAYVSVRFRQWPYLGGFHALGYHIDPVFRPEEWVTMTYNLHEPENAWAQSYDRHDRRMELAIDNVLADPGTTAQVFVDNIRLIRQRFSVICDIDDLYLDLGEREDLPNGASRYTYSLTLQNRTDEALTVNLRLDTSQLTRFSADAAQPAWHLPPEGAVEGRITVTVPASAKDAGLTPAYSETAVAHFVEPGHPDGGQSINLLAAVPFTVKSHPSLFATAEQFQAARQRMKQWGWARAAAGTYVRRADFAQAIPPGLPKFERRPEQPGDDRCPTCGDPDVVRRIQTDNPWRNECQYRYQCETCGAMLGSKLWRGGEAFAYQDSGYWWKPGDTNNAQGHAISFSREGNILDLAVGWKLTGNEDYLGRAADAIREYIHVLPSYPFSNAGNIAYSRFNSKGGVRVGNYFSQTGWLDRMAATLDILWDSGALTDFEKEALLGELTAIAYQRLRLWSPGYSNHRTTATALGISILSDNAPLLAYVLNDPHSGVHAFFRDTLLADGFPDMAAQYMEPVMLSWMPLFNTLQNAGIDLVARYPGLRRFGLSIQQWLDPDGLSPDLGDSCSSASLARHDWFEWCHAWTGDPRMIVPVQNHLYRQWVGSRHRVKWEDLGRRRTALFSGVENIPRGQVERPPESLLFPDYGLLIFNQGEGDRRLWAALPVGKPMGHGHNDNLHLEWWAMGQKQTIKQGSRSRHHAVHANTLLVDQRDQSKLPVTVSSFVDKGPVQGAVLTSTDLYPGTRITRTIMLYDGLVFLLDQFDSDREHDYDQVYLNAGTAHCDLPFKPLGQPLSDETNLDGVRVGYASLINPEQAPAPEQLEIIWNNLGVATNAAVRQTQIALGDPGVMLRVQAPLVKQHGQWERMTGDLAAAGYAPLPEALQRLHSPTYAEWQAPKYMRRFRARQAGVLTILEPFRGETPRLSAITRLPLMLDGKPVTLEGVAIRYSDENNVDHQVVLCPATGVKQAGGWTVSGSFTAGPNGPLVDTTIEK